MKNSATNIEANSIVSKGGAITPFSSDKPI